MSTQTVVEYIDATTGKTAERVEFTHEGVAYVIDLDPMRKRNFEKMREAYAGKMETFLAEAAPKTKPRKASDGEASRIRAWATAQGMTVGVRGRLSSTVINAYADAQKVAAGTVPAEDEATETE